MLFVIVNFCLSTYNVFLYTYQYLSTILGGGSTSSTSSNVQIEFSAQTTTMTFLELFVKLFTSILLILTFIMQANGTY